MNQPDKWFRWSFRLFVFLMCFQLGMLLFLKGLFYQAEQKLKDNVAEVDFRCEDFNDELSYWTLPSGLSQQNLRCQEEHCPESYWQARTQQAVELHVVATKSARPTQKREGEIEVGYFVDVKVAASDQPQILALVSQSLLQWNLNFSEKSQVKEVIIVGPELVWVQGLPSDVKLTYFTPEQICAYPTAWEESKNPDNEFRRLHLALETYTGLSMRSFQGQTVARKFQIPFRQSVRHQARRLASEQKSQPTKKQRLAPHRRDLLSRGLQWKRDKRRLRAKSFQFIKQDKLKRVSVPSNTRAAIYNSKDDSLYLIRHYQFGRWDWRTQSFQPIHLPLELAPMHWPTLMVHDSHNDEILVYNEERGGEIYAYQPQSGQWRVREQKLGYSLVAMDYLPKEKTLVGARHKAQKIDSFIKLGPASEVFSELPLKRELEFLKSHWRATLVSDNGEFWLKLSHPAHPGGDVYPLSKVISSLE